MVLEKIFNANKYGIGIARYFRTALRSSNSRYYRTDCRKYSNCSFISNTIDQFAYGFQSRRKLFTAYIRAHIKNVHIVSVKPSSPHFRRRLNRKNC